ncbi:hypothetical protein BCR33DRAFT_767391 [Rhizoclosmatium globosum]|uniref:Nucleotide-diphospho-sugar transferase domain-containing protein n=1 Tax=Rhizoclosmatium globosum TaxID=329046 RepID=A0A1Y2C3J3_9FUNG|nr:hypothetical protein BCR33DRAFT_767391 [Rhizoclosmatium globosum]|eukprot:ORY41526.1 hypothetical protein BCR33DRAFT_767391 [Rhizoclosmatium globosum]
MSDRKFRYLLIPVAGVALILTALVALNTRHHKLNLSPRKLFWNSESTNLQVGAQKAPWTGWDDKKWFGISTIDPNDKEALIAAGCFVDPTTYKPEIPVNEPLPDTANDAWERMYNSCVDITPPMLTRCPIPNAYHGVFGDGMEFKFHHYVALKSVHDVLKPFAMYIHGFNFPMQSELFQKAIQDFNLILVPSRKADKVFHLDVKVLEHQSDILRMEINTVYGGIYSDFDVFWLQPLHREQSEITDFYKEFLDGEHETVLAGQSPQNGVIGRVANGVLINKRCARFMQDWYKLYLLFNDQDWEFHSVILPHILWKTIGRTGSPADELVHVEHSSMQQPSYDWRSLIHTPRGFTEWNWTQNIACHLWIREYEGRDKLNFESIKTVNDPIGRMARYILWGNKKEKFDMNINYFINETDFQEVKKRGDSD